MGLYLIIIGFGLPTATTVEIEEIRRITESEETPIEDAETVIWALAS